MITIFSQYIYIILILIIIDFIGFLTCKKLDLSSKIYFPFGLAVLIGVFGFMSIPFVYLKTKFNIYLISMIIIFSVSIIYYSKGIYREYISRIKCISKIECLILLALLVFISLISLPAADGWLYNTLILSNIENNQLYITSGLNYKENVPLHNMDTVYAILSSIAFFAPGDKFLFVTTALGAIGVASVVSFYYLIGEQICLNRKLYLFFVISSLWYGIVILTPYYPRKSFLYFTYNMSLSGTLILITIVVALFIYYLVNEQNTNINFLFLPILLALSVSTSSFFIIPIFFLIYLKINKDKNVASNLFRFVAVYFIYVLAYLFSYSNYGIVSLVIIFILGFVINKIKISHTIIFKLVDIVFVILTILLLITLLLGFDFSLILNNSPKVLYGFRSNYYSGFYKYIFGIILFLIGFKNYNNKLIRKFTIISFIFFNCAVANTMWTTYLVPSLYSVFHRVGIFTFYYIYVLKGVEYIIEKFFISHKYLYVLLLFFLPFNNEGIYIQKDFKSDITYNSIYDYKTQSNSAYNLSQYAFEKGAYLDIGSYKDQRGKLGLFSIFQISPYLNFYDDRQPLLEEEECSINCYKVLDINNYNLSDGYDIVYEDDFYIMIKVR